MLIFKLNHSRKQKTLKNANVEYLGVFGSRSECIFFLKNNKYWKLEDLDVKNLKARLKDTKYKSKSKLTRAIFWEKQIQQIQNLTLKRISKLKSSKSITF